MLWCVVVPITTGRTVPMCRVSVFLSSSMRCHWRPLNALVNALLVKHTDGGRREPETHHYGGERSADASWGNEGGHPHRMAQTSLTIPVSPKSVPSPPSLVPEVPALPPV